MWADEYTVSKISTTEVDFSSIGAETLFTVPPGYIFVPLFVVVRVAGDCGGDSSADENVVLTFGRSTQRDDFLDWQDLQNMNASGDMCILKPPVPGDVDSSGDKALPEVLKVYAAGIEFDVEIVNAGGVAGNKIDLFGYLVDV